MPYVMYLFFLSHMVVYSSAIPIFYDDNYEFINYSAPPPNLALDSINPSSPIYLLSNRNCRQYLRTLSLIVSTIGIWSDPIISRYSTKEHGNKLCHSLFSNAWSKATCNHMPLPPHPFFVPSRREYFLGSRTLSNHNFESYY